MAFNAKPIRSGPYRVAAWDRGSVVHLVANLPDTTTALVQLKTGELDALLGGDVGLGSHYAALPRYRTSNLPYTGASIVAFNTERGVFADRRIRRAIARGIDRVRLVADVTRGFATAHDAWRGLFSYADDPHAPWPTYDPGAAAADLDRAGWRLGPGRRRRSVRARQIRSRTRPLFQQRSTPTSRGSSRVENAHRTAITTRGIAIRTSMRPCVIRRTLSTTKARRAELARVQRLVANDVPLLPLYQSRELDVIPRNVDGFVANGTLPYDSVEHWRIRPSR